MGDGEGGLDGERGDLVGFGDHRADLAQTFGGELAHRWPEPHRLHEARLAGVGLDVFVEVGLGEVERVRRDVSEGDRERPVGVREVDEGGAEARLVVVAAAEGDVLVIDRDDIGRRLAAGGAELAEFEGQQTTGLGS